MKQQWLNADQVLAKFNLVESCQQYSSEETLPDSSDSENEQQSEKKRKEIMENKGTEVENEKQGEKERRNMTENKGTEDENGNQSEKDKSHKSPTMKQQQLNGDQALVKLKLVDSYQQYSLVETLPDSSDSDSENEKQRSVSDTMDPSPTFMKQSAQGCRQGPRMRGLGHAGGLKMQGAIQSRSAPASRPVTHHLDDSNDSENKELFYEGPQQAANEQNCHSIFDSAPFRCQESFYIFLQAKNAIVDTMKYCEML